MGRRLEDFGLRVLRGFDPETAHGLALKALRYGLADPSGYQPSDRVQVDLAGLSLPNPVGLAAGFDKNAEALAALPGLGFGFLEVGAATPKPQPGNPRPRLFRLDEDEAVINRFGFNNDGAALIAERLRKRPAGAVVGLNLGANKDSSDRAKDYVDVLRLCGAHVDFVTVNVSSPNTANLRDLQTKTALWSVLTGVLDARAELPHPVKVFLKIAPDLDRATLEDIAEVATTSSLDGIIATNTTIARPDTLRSAHRKESGGLSGEPLFDPSTRVLARLSELTSAKLPLIGVGGIGTAEDAYAKIRAGARAVQLYSALVYRGPSLVAEIVRGLDQLLERDGYANVAEAVGTDRARWLD